MENDSLEFWAKDTGETLLSHSLNVAHVAKMICHMLPFSFEDRKKLAETAYEIGLLHDLGKSATGFQRMLRGYSRWRHRHEILSAAVAAHIAPDLSPEELLAIITHHRSIPPKGEGTTFEKCLPDNELPFIKPNLFDEMIADIKSKENTLIQFLIDLDKEGRYKWHTKNLNINFQDIGPLKQYWLRRQTHGQKDKTTIKQRRYASLLRGLLVTADHLASANQFNLPQVPVQNNFISTIHRHELKGEKILPFQARCAETLKNIILKAPTGSGKTAAILLWAAKNQSANGRLFYVLPHTASINAMHQRLQNIYGESIVGVLHHKNAAYLFYLFENDNCSLDAAKMAQTISGLARELYHPIRVTTPHQILRAALKGKGWELGLSEFPNACFVFDEIHAFEPLLVGLTIATIKWLKTMGAKTLFASATLPSFLEAILKDEVGISDENIISPNPEDKDDKGIMNKIRHRIEIRPGSLISNIDSIINEIKTSKKTSLIICNHVTTSQKVWKNLSYEFSEVKLLHARFNAKDRFRIEKTIQGENPPKVLVATQAVEVSLDLDYGCGYIEPAPADALGQRLGRINRKGSRSKPAPVIIFEEPSAKIKEKPLYLPYDKDVTKKTISLLNSISLLTEQQLTDIVNEIYRDGYTGESKNDYVKGLKNSQIANFDNNIIAGTYKDWVEDVIEGSDGQIEILPTDLYDEFLRLKEEKRFLEAKFLLVPIQTRKCKKLFQEGVLKFDKKSDEYRTSLKYSFDYGLDFEKQIENIF